MQEMASIRAARDGFRVLRPRRRCLVVVAGGRVPGRQWHVVIAGGTACVVPPPLPPGGERAQGGVGAFSQIERCPPGRAWPWAPPIPPLVSTALHVPTRELSFSLLSRGEPCVSSRRTHRPSGRPEMGSAFFVWSSSCGRWSPSKTGGAVRPPVALLDSVGVSSRVVVVHPEVGRI